MVGPDRDGTLKIFQEKVKELKLEKAIKITWVM